MKLVWFQSGNSNSETQVIFLIFILQIYVGVCMYACTYEIKYVSVHILTLKLSEWHLLQ